MPESQSGLGYQLGNLPEIRLLPEGERLYGKVSFRALAFLDCEILKGGVTPLVGSR